MEANLAVLVEKYGDMDAKGMMNEKSALLKQSETIAASRYTVHGEMIQMNAQIKIATTELNQPKYKSANLNYLKVFYEVTVIKKMIEDLGKYRSALEGALLQYHAQKMEQINRTIRALWTSIYR